ncbi:MAG: hypothetical protein A2Z25_13080 [Planctomycetes bacterium RBG_16_55_9]|nr:MAG: hypothetical protein A2Z25_13080 [Planctomycetes bacterium RBG_16_55_9]
MIMKVEIQLQNKECDTGTHTDHLCYLISQGFNLSDEPWFKTLTNDPQFRCEHCGRTAKSEANLCVPGHL